MAGAGRRTFAPGEVLTASNVMNYLQDQAVMNFAGTAARGSAIGTAVAQGMTSFRQDTGTYETYYAAYGTANPGGRTTAGWYKNTNNDGLVPIIPTSVSVPGGSASVDALGKITYSTTSSTNGVTVNGCFTSSFRNYKLVITVPSSNANSAWFFRLSAGGTAASGNGYMVAQVGGSTSTGSTEIEVMYGNYTTGSSSTEMHIYQPAETVNTAIAHDWFYDDGGTFIGRRYLTRHRQGVSYDGFKLYGPTSVTNATLQIFGYNW